VSPGQTEKGDADYESAVARNRRPAVQILRESVCIKIRKCNAVLLVNLKLPSAFLEKLTRP
jgi:hypothetical protein